MSRSSLKGFIPVLALTFGMTPAALYERQRTLVRAGLLQGETGRGPGSGVRATAGSVALLLTALLATDSLSETDDRAKVIAQLKPKRRLLCPLTGMSTFTDALAAILVSKSMSKKVLYVRVERTESRAHIGYMIGSRHRWSEFCGDLTPKPGYGWFQVAATINSPVLRSIADELRAILGEES